MKSASVIEGSNLREKDSLLNNFTLLKSTKSMTSANITRGSNLSNKDFPENNFTFIKSTKGMTSAKTTQGNNLSEKLTSDTNFSLDINTIMIKANQMKSLMNKVTPKEHSLSYTQMYSLSFTEVIDEYIKNSASSEAVTLVQDAQENYELFDPLFDGSYDMQNFASVSNEEVLDTMHSFGGYTWSLLYAADFLYRNGVWLKETIMQELFAIEKFRQYCGSLSSMDIAINGMVGSNIHNTVSEFKKLENGFYLALRLKNINIHDTISWISGRYIQYELFLRDKLSELAGKITAEQLAYLIYYKQQGGYLDYFNGDQIKVLKQICKEYNRQGYKYLQGKYNKIVSQAYRQVGSENNVHSLQAVKKLLTEFPLSIPHLEKDLKEAELNNARTEGGKWKG